MLVSQKLYLVACTGLKPKCFVISLNDLGYGQIEHVHILRFFKTKVLRILSLIAL